MKVVIDDCRLERMDAYTEPLNDKIKRQAAEITRLLAENAELKEKLHEEHHELVWQDGYSQGISSESEKWNENVKIIRDNAFEAGQVKGQNDAWKLMIKMGNMYCDDLIKVFSSSEPWEIITRLSYNEAAAKVAEWERQKKEIRVGDVLLSNSIREKCVVTAKHDGIFTLLWTDGSSGDHGEKAVREYKKVGHIDVNAWLAQIGGESDE